jgi:DNA-binding response OmpR family regulator
MSDREALIRDARETMRKLQHEVRTPVSQIVGYSELLEDELVDRGQEDLTPDLQKIRDAAQRLLDLLDGKLRSDEQNASESERAGAADSEAQGPGETSSQPRILVVDDDANDRELLARRLSKQGFDVSTASDGIEGLRRIETEDWDLVLLEIMMPGMSGLEVLERVRRERSRSELPVILATALRDSSDQVEGLDRGANDYITKPFDFPAVVARVRSQLAAHRSARQVTALARHLEYRNTFIRQAMGREMSEDLLVEMSETPDSTDLGSQAMSATAIVADVKGGRELARSLSPGEFSVLLRNVLGGLAEVVAHYEGTVDAFAGDALVALFGLPTPRDDDVERGVACAVALQLEMQELNERNRRVSLPEVEIGVGVYTGQVVVGGFGSGDKLRYKAIGEPLVRAGGVERVARGGEVWICPDTYEAVSDLVHVDSQREALLPGADDPMLLRRVLGVGDARGRRSQRHEK